MQSVEFENVCRITERFEAVRERFPDLKKRALDAIGSEMLKVVQENIGGSGKVSDWQSTFHGTGGGWVAVRAKAKTFQTTKAGKKYAVGRITNAIEHGHKIRPPSGMSGRYRPRLTSGSTRVPGKMMYLTASLKLISVADAAADSLLEALTKEMEG